MIALANPQRFHGAVEQAFPGERRRRLWRLDPLGGKLYLMILSEDAPDLSGIEEQFGSGEPGETKSYDPLLERILPDSVWRFRLTANPTVSSASFMVKSSLEQASAPLLLRGGGAQKTTQKTGRTAVRGLSASPFGPSGAAGPAFSLRQCGSVGRSSGLGSPGRSPFPQALQWRWSGPPPYGGGPARELHPLPYSPGLCFRAPAGDFFLIVPNLGPSVNEKARRRARRAKKMDYLGWVSRWNFSR